MTVHPLLSTTIRFTATSVHNNTIMKLNSSNLSTNLVTNQESSNQNLNYYNNTFTIEVTAEDLYTKSFYRIIVYRPSSNADIDMIIPTYGSLIPSFNGSLHSVYHLFLPVHISTSIQYRAIVLDNKKQLFLNGIQTNSNTTSMSTTIIPSINNLYSYKVIAEDGFTTKYYNITAYQPSSESRLVSITPSYGTLSTTFNPNQTEYLMILSPYISTNITFIINFMHLNSSAQIQVFNSSFSSFNNNQSPSFQLLVYNNTFTIQVIAEDLFTKSYYTIIVYRPSSNTDLNSLTSSFGQLVPNFHPTIYEYTIKLIESVSTNINFTASVIDMYKKIQFNGNPINSGVTTNSTSLNLYNNTFIYNITAEDKITNHIYTIVVYRPSSESRLVSITPSYGTLSPLFTPNQTEYLMILSPYISTNITFIPIVKESLATIRIQISNFTQIVPSNTSSPNFQLLVYNNTFTIQVIAEDLFTKSYYTIIVYRPSSNTDLNSLTSSFGQLVPNFHPTIYEYTIKLIESVSTNINFTASVIDMYKKIQFNGNPINSGVTTNSTSLNLYNNTFIYNITAEDKITNHIYTIVVYRPSSESRLASITPSYGTLSPLFTPNQNEYAISVPYAITVIGYNATTIDNKAIILYLNSTTTSLSVGSNFVYIDTIAEDGYEKSQYKLNITRLPSENALLLMISSYYCDNITDTSQSHIQLLQPIFSSNLFNYVVKLPHIKTSICLKAQTHHDKAYVSSTNYNNTININKLPRINNEYDEEISYYSNILVGVTTIDFTITAHNGFNQQHYYVHIQRASSNVPDFGQISLFYFWINSTTTKNKLPILQTPNKFEINRYDYNNFIDVGVTSIEISGQVAIKTANLSSISIKDQNNNTNMLLFNSTIINILDFPKNINNFTFLASIINIQPQISNFIIEVKGVAESLKDFSTYNFHFSRCCTNTISSLAIWTNTQYFVFPPNLFHPHQMKYNFTVNYTINELVFYIQADSVDNTIHVYQSGNNTQSENIRNQLAQGIIQTLLVGINNIYIDINLKNTNQTVNSYQIIAIRTQCKPKIFLLIFFFVNFFFFFVNFFFF